MVRYGYRHGYKHEHEFGSLLWYCMSPRAITSTCHHITHGAALPSAGCVGGTVAVAIFPDRENLVPFITPDDAPVHDSSPAHKRSQTLYTAPSPTLPACQQAQPARARRRRGSSDTPDLEILLKPLPGPGSVVFKQILQIGARCAAARCTAPGHIE